MPDGGNAAVGTQRCEKNVCNAMGEQPAAGPRGGPAGGSRELTAGDLSTSEKARR